MLVWHSQAFWVWLSKVLSTNKVGADQGFPDFEKQFTVGSQQLDSFHSALHFCSFTHKSSGSDLLERFGYTCNLCSPHHLRSDSFPLIFSLFLSSQYNPFLSSTNGHFAMCLPLISTLPLVPSPSLVHRFSVFMGMPWHRVI